MRPNSNQPARLFATAKTRKFSNFEDIDINNLKIRPIVDQTGTHTDAAAKVISGYLQPLTNNEYVITNTLTFADSIKSVNISHSEDFVSYDVESLFTSIPVDETIAYICDRIYVHNKIAPILQKEINVPS